MAMLKELTWNQMKENLMTYYNSRWPTLFAKELLTFAYNFIHIYKLERIKNLLLTPFFTKIQNKLV